MENMLDLRVYIYLSPDDGEYFCRAQTWDGGAGIDRITFKAKTWFDLMAQVRAWHLERSSSYFTGCWPEVVDVEAERLVQSTFLWPDDEEQY